MYSISGNILTFAYETDRVFNMVKMLTAYRMRDMTDKDGNLTGEPLMMTADERDLFNLTVNNAAMFVCEELKKLSQGISNMFIIDGDRLIFNIVNHRKYNINALQSIDTAIFNLLYNSCLYQFYDFINQEKQAELFKTRFVESSNILHERCHEIRKIR
ncbi:MAG: hypothetical protein LBP85_08495 [Prevotellaceae bacterium]|jgi:hypothetical protein|nr:hypothetical protein [Prevotellaceae bacterium]